ncbi:septum site-determining protein DivIVA [Ravibacter arvi]|uniref:Septum site-determining protein DivIVA n=1 Tax=Ravibacter arvi TaxID=2051041 RepID=A0ABP8LR46_9BACT
MKISIADIKNHSFEKSFRGYEPAEVHTFLGELSKEMERINDDNKLLKMQLEIAEKELSRLKDVETSLFRTLKNAEENSARITEQAQEMAETYLKDSRQQTDEIMLEAQKKANMMLQEAENKARYVQEEAVNSIKDYERECKALEKYRDLLVGEIRVLIGNLSDTLEKYEKKYPREASKERLEEVAEPKQEEVKSVRVKGSRNPALAKKNEPNA